MGKEKDGYPYPKGMDELRRGMAETARILKEEKKRQDELQEKSSKPWRMKYWEELDSVEKIERLRSEVKSLLIDRAEIFRRLARLEAHEHLLNGKSAVPLKDHCLFPTGIENLGRTMPEGQEYI
jgi:hypothetical protein